MLSYFLKTNLQLHNDYIMMYDPGNYHLGIKIKQINFLN